MNVGFNWVPLGAEKGIRKERKLRNRDWYRKHKQVVSNWLKSGQSRHVISTIPNTIRKNSPLRKEAGICAPKFVRQNKNPLLKSNGQVLAQRKGFEPLEALTSTVFKTAAIDHSAISAYSKPYNCNKTKRFCQLKIIGFTQFLIFIFINFTILKFKW